MSLELLLLLPIVVGHLALCFFLANVLHSFGHTERVLGPLKLVLLLTLVGVAAFLGWQAWSGPVASWSWAGTVYAAVCLVMGLVVFPAATVHLHHRRPPEGITERETVLDLAARHGAETLIGGGRHSWLLRLPGNQSLRLRKVEWELTLPGLPPALDGISVLHLSDLHLSPCYDRRYFEAVAEVAASWESDLVLFTGDLVDHEESTGWIVPLLSKVRGEFGSYAVLGNHDMDHDPDRLRGLLRECGYADVEAGWATVSVRGKTLALGGTAYPWGRPLPMADRPKADFSILLSHSPDLFYRAERAGFDLMLSGHNHGGQVRLPLVGPVFMPSVYSRRFDRGFFRKRRLTLHVSQGVAAQHPVRYGCPPEIGRLVLRAGPVQRRDGGFLAHGRGLTLSGDSTR